MNTNATSQPIQFTTEQWPYWQVRATYLIVCDDKVTLLCVSIYYFIYSLLCSQRFGLQCVLKSKFNCEHFECKTHYKYLFMWKQFHVGSYIFCIRRKFVGIVFMVKVATTRRKYEPKQILHSRMTRCYHKTIENN